MAISVEKLIHEFRVNERIPIANGETIPANDDGGVGLAFDANGRATLATSGAATIGISNQREDRTGDADGTVFAKFDPADAYTFKFPQGDLLDAEVAVGEKLDFNAAADGFQTGTNEDAEVIGHTVNSLGETYVMVRLLNVLPVQTP